LHFSIQHHHHNMGHPEESQQLYARRHRCIGPPRFRLDLIFKCLFCFPVKLDTK
jgi:hypothetical protein